MSGAIKIVASLSDLEAMVLVESMPGIAQANELRSGIKDLP
jgi:hypothetical protein